MKLIEFIQFRFQECMVRQKDGFSWAADGESQALMFVLKWIQRFFCAVYIIKVPFHYALVRLDLLPRPVPEMDVLKEKEMQDKRVINEAMNKQLLIQAKKGKL